MNLQSQGLLCLGGEFTLPQQHQALVADRDPAYLTRKRGASKLFAFNEQSTCVTAIGASQAPAAGALRTGRAKHAPLAFLDP